MSKMMRVSGLTFEMLDSLVEGKSCSKKLMLENVVKKYFREDFVSRVGGGLPVSESAVKIVEKVNKGYRGLGEDIEVWSKLFKGL